MQKSIQPPTSADPSVPLTGPAAIQHALSKINLDEVERRQRELIASKKVSKRSDAVSTLNVIEGLRRNNLQPSDMMITRVPVIPPAFRPFSLVGNTFVAGDANELYGEIFKMREAHREMRDTFGEGGAHETRAALYNAIRSAYGYAEPESSKLQARGVSGFLKQVTGSSPKFSFVQRKLLAKPQDNVARGTIAVNPELTINEIEVPYDMAWNMYAPYVQRRLVQAGIPAAEAVRAVRERNDHAKKMLEREVEDRLVVYSRAPAWHKYNTVSGRVKLTEGNTISINPFVTTGLNADFDGDTINLHVPSTPDAVREAKELLLPSKMLFSIRDQEKVVPKLKHEQVLGLFTANAREAKETFDFPTKEEAIKAVKSRRVPMSAELTVMGSPVF